MFEFAINTIDMTAVEILNYYRNLYYAESQVTERGIVANAINDYFNEAAPRAEVEAEFEKRLAQYQDKEKCIYTYDGEIWDYCVQGPCPHHKTLEALRQEVAKEIFEDLLRDITHGLEIARTTRKKFLHNIERNHIWVYHYDGEIKALEGIECLIAELKKKYTQEVQYD